MKKYFGTDGVRGVANEELTVKLAYQIGRYLGYHFCKTEKAKIIIAKDTRLSSSMLETAVISGALESGADVFTLGYSSTPSVAYLVTRENFSCGIMISASHNPYQDNGIKVFQTNGTKIDEQLEKLLEDYLKNPTELPKASPLEIGRLTEYTAGIQHYLDYLKTVNKQDLQNLKIAVDLANGASCFTAPKLLSALQVKAEYFFAEPDGLNINNNCGSTHLSRISEIVKNGDYAAGFAFDGDGDRLLAIDSLGEVVDGDAILFICGKYLRDQNALNNNTIVTTVMSNLGLYKALGNQKIKTAITAVGDKYVFEEMKKKDYNLGGEQSGHIIFRDYGNTGDGLLTLLILLEIMAETKCSLEELSEELRVYPQLLVNLAVKDKSIIDDPQVKLLVSDIEQKLGDEGRILVRTSGTEALIRVMVEAQSEELCQSYVGEVIEQLKVINNRG